MCFPPPWTSLEHAWTVRLRSTRIFWDRMKRNPFYMISKSPGNPGACWWDPFARPRATKIFWDRLWKHRIDKNTCFWNIGSTISLNTLPRSVFPATSGIVRPCLERSMSREHQLQAIAIDVFVFLQTLSVQFNCSSMRKSAYLSNWTELKGFAIITKCCKLYVIIVCIQIRN